MKRTMKFAAIFALMLGLGFTAGAKKLEILKFDKGEIPNNLARCSGTLSEEHSAKKGGVALKVVSDGPDCWLGEVPPIRGMWDGFDLVRIGIFNATKEPKKMNFVIKPKSNSQYNDRFDYNCSVKPGQNEIEIELVGACTNGGAPLAIKERIAIWTLGGNFAKGETFYMQYMRAETADEADKK